MVSAWIKKKPGYYVFREVEDEEIKELGIKHYKFKCKKCGSKNDYWAQKDCFPYRCQFCQDTGKIPDKSSSIYSNNIPDWRLTIDDMKFDEILNVSPKEYGMPQKSYQQWQDHYHNTPYEKKKMREFNRKKERLIKELYGSPSSSKAMSGRKT